MKRHLTGLALVLSLAACGGTPPFGGDATGGGETTDGAGAIPAELANNLQSFTYDPTAQTLTVTGVPLDDGPISGVYRRRPGLDRGGYEAYTAQDGSLDRHSTAYVKRINGTQAAVVVTGVQFEEFFGGTAYSNTSYSAPSPAGSVSYAGNYVGMLNGPGSNEDVTPVTPGTPPDPLTAQAAEVTGKVSVTADFSDATVDGIIYDRVVQDYNTGGLRDPNSGSPLQPANLALDAATIETDGTFFGQTTVQDDVKGEWGGIFGGSGATEVAGVVHAEQHIDVFDGEIEYGAFVLAQCGTPDEDPICTQPVP